MNAKTHDNPESHNVVSPAESGSTGNWKDPKRYMWLLGPALPGIGLAALTGYALAPKKLKALGPGLDRPCSGARHHSGAGQGHW